MPLTFVRSCRRGKLPMMVDSAPKKTGSMLQYVGEWHSHPDGFSVKPSGDDRAEFEWLAGYMQADGLVPLMLIAGENGEAWFLNTMG